jgi:hypothetical protein
VCTLCRQQAATSDNNRGRDHTIDFRMSSDERTVIQYTFKK